MARIPKDHRVEGSWWCEACQQVLDWDEVTFQERHDPRAGGCGKPVEPQAFGPCYQCRDGDHQLCIGVPCQCTCPIPEPAAVALTFAGRVAALRQAWRVFLRAVAEALGLPCR